MTFYFFQSAWVFKKSYIGTGFVQNYNQDLFYGIKLTIPVYFLKSIFPNTNLSLICS